MDLFLNFQVIPPAIINPKLDDIFSEPGPRLKVALCQVWTRCWDVEGNHQRTLQALGEAGAAGARLAITPECVFHGYANSGTKAETLRRLHAVAEPADGERIARIREIARTHSMAVVVGFAEAGEGRAVHNSAAVISPQGAILQVYRKVHCRDFEHVGFEGGFTPGDSFEVVKLEWEDASLNLGTLICFDREIPESVRCLRALGADLVACPLATETYPLNAPPNYAENEVVTRVRAAENEVFFVVVNHSGRCNGGSFVLGPGGECLRQLGPEPETACIDLPVEALRARIHGEPYGWMGWGYRRPEVYQRILGADSAGS